MLLRKSSLVSSICAAPSLTPQAPSSSSRDGARSCSLLPCLVRSAAGRSCDCARQRMPLARRFSHERGGAVVPGHRGGHAKA
eukprot:8437-Heterococcus_DN1.PRE.2